MADTRTHTPANANQPEIQTRMENCIARNFKKIRIHFEIYLLSHSGHFNWRTVFIYPHPLYCLLRPAIYTQVWKCVCVYTKFNFMQNGRTGRKAIQNPNPNRKIRRIKMTMRT